MDSSVKKGIFGAILIGVVFLGVRYVFPIQNTNSLWESRFQTADENSTKLQKRLDLALQQIQELKRTNARKENTCEPTYLHEKRRRQLELDMKEMWYTIRGHSINIGRKDFEQIKDIYRLLRGSLWKLRQEDGYEIYRELETEKLSRIIQKRLHDLQNPPDCASAKKLVCSIRQNECGVGFGCQIHQLVYCVAVAYATSRTIILESEGWQYIAGGWEQVFLPVSETCTSSAGSTKADWGSGNHDVQVLVLPMWIVPRPPYLPMAIPSDIADRLEKVHGEPHIWWIGQFVTYLLRLQPKTQVLLDEAKSKMNISSPTVGVHVRRTDKVGAEAEFYPLKEYMEHVNEYFSIREKFESPVKRKVFIASDDPNVIDEAERTYNGVEWQIMGDKSVAQSASVHQRRNGLFGIIKDVLFLSECDYVVCTFSSNVCRLAYAIMQTRHADPSGRFVSLDFMYHYHGGGSSYLIQTARFDHKPRSSEELELAVGDKIELPNNRWNGMSKGTNHRTNKTGLYPSYKARNSYVKVNFPQEKWWTESEDA